MALAFDVEIVAADHVVYRDQAVSLIAPGAAGYFGVLREHAPLISTLKIGALTISPLDAPPIIFAISGGFAEVTPDKVIVLADSAERADEIDVARAREARDRAEARLRERADEIDSDRATTSLARALNRLNVATGQQ